MSAQLPAVRQEEVQVVAVHDEVGVGALVVIPGELLFGASALARTKRGLLQVRPWSVEVETHSSDRSFMSLHLAVEAHVLALRVPVVVEGHQRLAVGQQEQHGRRVGMDQRRGRWFGPGLAIVRAAGGPQMAFGRAGHENTCPPPRLSGRPSSMRLNSGTCQPFGRGPGRTVQVLPWSSERRRYWRVWSGLLRPVGFVRADEPRARIGFASCA